MLIIPVNDSSMKHRNAIQRPAFSWQPIRNVGFTLGASLRKVIALREGGLTQGWIRAAFHYGRYVESLQRSQGWRGAVIHLKGCHVLLQQIVGGQKLDNPRRLGCAIGRSRTGIPLVIPFEHRVRILHGDVWAVRIWSSFFWLYRVLEIPGKVKLSTITKPFVVNYLVIVEWCRWLVLFLPVFLALIGRPQDGQAIASKRRSLGLKPEETSLLMSLVERPAEFIELLTAFLLPHRESDLCKKLPRKEWGGLMKPILTELQPRALLLLNSGPNSAKSMDESPGPTTRTNIGSVLTDLYLWVHEDEGLWASIRKLWAPAAAFAQSALAQAKAVFKQLEDFGVKGDYGRFFAQRADGVYRSDPLPGFSTPWGLGKLSFIPEPAGKIRVVAMVDSLTQMILRPLHDAVFEILRKIPQDGTFDQVAPAYRLAAKKFKALWSYDLSAATDRFPVCLQQALLSYLIGPRVALAWTRLLTGRTFRVPRRVSEKQRVPRGTPETVHYAAGQPMGAYTSWAVFALSHHFLIQFSAYQAFGTLKWFEDYALLGDDVVIANNDVAEKYLLLLRAIGVEVGLAKSLISRRGVFEFAKRTFRITDEGLLVDISGVSLAAIAAAITDSSVMESLLSHANVRSAGDGLRVASRVLGYGYRTRSSLGGEIESMNSRLKGLLIMLSRPSGVWGLNPAAWFLQVTARMRGTLSDERYLVFMDALKQRLVSSARRLADVRRARLYEWNNPVDEAGNPVSQIPSLPRTWFRTSSPLYNEFVREWIFNTLLTEATRDLRELLGDLILWEESSTIVGDGPLNGPAGHEPLIDEIYTKLMDLQERFSRLDTEVNLFIRRNTEKSDSRKMIRKRSAVVKLWRACRALVSGHLEH